MRNEKARPLPRRIVSLGKRIENWRRTRKRISPMPERLWEAAAKLAKKHGVFSVARAAGIDFGALKRRVEESYVAESNPEGFVELRPVEAGAPDIRRESSVVVDFTGDTGMTMTFRISEGAGFNLVALANAFWSRRRT